MDGNADGAGLIGDRAGDGLSYPPGGVGGKLVSASVFKLLDGLHEAHIPFLDEVEEGEAAVGVLFGNGDDEAKVGLNHFALGFLALVHPALEHPDVLFELFEVAPSSELPFEEFSPGGSEFAGGELVLLSAGV